MCTHRNLKLLGKVCANLARGTKEKDLKAQGPGCLPSKTLRIATRKTLRGESVRMWDCSQMRICKQRIDLHSAEIVKQVTPVSIEPGVEVEVTIADA
ncbi:40S ribosomal protein S20 [Lemmus lemmus]